MRCGWMTGAAVLCLAGLPLALGSGCSESPKEETQAQAPRGRAAAPIGMPEGHGGMMPPGGSEAGKSFSKADVEKLQAQADALEAQAKAKPADSALKLRAADADYRAGDAMMLTDALDRKVKYRGALKYFRRALALNPRHRDAASEKRLIESIYQQMGRPIPQ